jgi:hypothetical protein
MKKEDLKAAFDKIQPEADAENRMLKQIINKSSRKESAMGILSVRRLIPVLGLIVILAGSLLLSDKLPLGSSDRIPEGGVQTDDFIGREDAVAPVQNQFRLDDRHYILLSDELREEYGFSPQVTEDQIGVRIASIESTPDESLKGLEVYHYNPAGGEAVIAVKKEEGYQLFNFFTFESYNNNQDEDASVYLKLYGINGPHDIQAVRFIEYTEQSKVEGGLNIIGELNEAAEIEEFYRYYSELKNASDKYFERLFGYQPNGVDYGNVTTDPAGQELDKGQEPELNTGQVAPDQGGTTSGIEAPADEPVQAIDLPLDLDAPVSSNPDMMDRGDTESGSTGDSIPPSQGSAGNALANPIGVRIYNKNGVYYETMYYRNIGFLSRYEVNPEFAAFIQSHIE